METSNHISLPLHVFHNTNASLEPQRGEAEITGKGASPSFPQKPPTIQASYFTGKKEKSQLLAALDLELCLDCHV